MKTTAFYCFRRFLFAFISLLFISSISDIYSQDPLPVEWHTFYGGHETDYSLTDQGYAICVTDDAIYVGGLISGPGNFGGATINRPYTQLFSARDGFVAKMSLDGETVEWVTFLGSKWSDECKDLKVVGGYIYVCGYSGGVWDDEEALGTKVKHGHFSGNGNDGFVAKLNMDGDLNWLTFVGAVAGDFAEGLAVDESSGNVLVCGYSDESWITDGYQNNVVQAHSGGEEDAWALKLDIDGNYLWHTFMGGDQGNGETDIGTGIGFDGSSNIYVGGNSTGTWGSPLAGFHHRAAPTDIYPQEGFIAKLNPAGTLQWNMFIGNTENPGTTDGCRDIVVDPEGNIYATGFTSGDWDLGAWGPAIVEYGSNESNDLFVTKINTDGAPQWHTILGAGSGNTGEGIVLADNGDLFITGVDNAVWGDPAFPKYVDGGTDHCIVKLDNDGNLLWNVMVGGFDPESGLDIATDNEGNAYTTGYSQYPWACVGTALHPHIGNPMSNGAHTEIVVAKINTNLNSIIPENIFLSVVQGETALTPVRVFDNCNRLGDPTTVVGVLTDNGDGTWTWSLVTTLSTPLGHHYIEISANDGNGCAPHTIIDLEVLPANLPPEITCPDDITINLTIGCTSDDDIGFATATDDFDQDIEIVNDAPEFFQVGETIVTWTATDDEGLFDTCEQIITVLESEPPLITCPANIWLECPAADTSPEGTGYATATDNCDSEVDISHSDEVLASCGNTEIIIRTWTATDECGNSSSCVQTITVEDTTPPEITCPPEVTLECPDADTSPAATGEATAIDNCDPSVVISYSDVVIDGCGSTLTITRTWTAEDDCENISSCDQTITVADNAPPILLIPDDIEVFTDSGDCGARVLIGDASASDLCGEVILSNDDIGFYPLGSTEITWTASDQCGNEISKKQTIIVKDNSPPIPDLNTLPVITANCGVEITDIPTATDICAGYISGTTINSLVYTSKGTYLITWDYDDGSGNVSSQDQTIIIIDDVAPFPDAINGLPDLIGECEATITVFPTATDNCSGIIEGTTTDPLFYNTEGTHIIHWIYDDGNGNISSQNQKITIYFGFNPPEITDVTGPPDPISLGTEAELIISFSDDNATGATVDWGDGETSTVNQPLNSFSVYHTYQETGVYQVFISISDACESTSTYTYSYIILYDPSAGFVTGGGWINSPEGAYKDDATLSGKANFGFVSKYKKGQTIPVGNTEFQFKAADLNFHSSSYDWLVIAGHKAMFKGNGTINGSGDYGFMLSAIDAELTPSVDIDRFRIKIWDSATDLNVYDNNVGSSDYDEPTTDIAGGSIKIHKGKKFEEIGNISTNPFSSFNVYPNPFSDIIWFEFSPATDSRAILEIYDLTGRKLASLINKNVKAGQEYRLNYQPGSDVANGILFYKLILDGEVKTGKIVHRR